MKHVKRKRAWTLVILLALNFIILCIPANIIYNNVRSLIIEELAKNAMNTASVVANMIEEDITSYEKLINVKDYTTGNYDTAYYNKMLTIFEKLKLETGASFLFTEKKLSGDKINYILDGEDPASENFSPIGSEDTMGEVELKSFNEGTILATDMIMDPVWGEFLTGFAPIKNHSTNEVIGLVGVGFFFELC